MPTTDLYTLRADLEKGVSIFALQLRVAFYARVSTDKQEQHGSLENQQEFYENFIVSNENWVFAGGYTDDGVSGTGVFRRDGFLKMIDDGKEGKFDLVITKEISRFSRNTLDSIKYTRELLSYGVGVYFQNDNINTFLPDSELRLTIMASIAQDEVRKISGRVRFGLKRSVEKGRVLGQDNMLGYKKSGGILYIDQAEAETVRRIFCLYAEGNIGLKTLAKRLYDEGISCRDGKMLSYSTLYGIITNPKYKGYYCGGKYTKDLYSHTVKRIKSNSWHIKKDGNIPAIVSEEMWEEANRILKARGEVFGAPPGTTARRYPYSGLILCDTHGCSYHRSVFRSKSGEREVWQCAEYRRHGRKSGCSAPTVYTSEINSALSAVLPTDIKALCGRLAVLYGKTGQGAGNDTKSATEEKIRRLKGKKDRLLELCIDGVITKEDFTVKNSEITEKIRVLTEKSTESHGELPKSITASDIFRIFSASQPEAVLACATEKIWVGEDAGGITFRILMKNGKEYSVRSDTEKNALSVA